MTGSRRSGDSTPGVGHDAFLDIVANLVGILIILVVILGSHTREVAEAIRERADELADTPPPTDEQLETMLAELQRESRRAAQALSESQRLESTIVENDKRLELARQQRGKMLDLLELAKQAWQEQQQQLDAEAVQEGKAAARLAAARSELENLKQAKTRLNETESPVVAVSHLPTPMAKTVFGEELHLRLKGGLLSVVPIDQLVEEIQRDFHRTAQGSRQGRHDAAVGPIQGFVAKYELEKSRETVNRGGQMAAATRIQLVNMVVEPLQEPHGQPLESTLVGDATMLDIQLAGRDPDRTTVTVWVYPDSFRGFRKLKEHLYERGYATAARPLPMNMPISGGPQGTKSRAQ